MLQSQGYKYHRTNIIGRFSSQFEHLKDMGEEGNAPLKVDGNEK
jgi:hypothetical protein